MGFVILCVVVVVLVILLQKNSQEEVKNNAKNIMQVGVEKQMVMNFIKKTPSKYLLLPENIGALEYYIAANNKSADPFLLTDTVSKLRTVNNEMKDFYENEYYMFVEIFSKKAIASSVSQKEITVYELLKEAVLEYYSQQFEESYGSYFLEIRNYKSSFNVNQIIKKYCEIENIVYNDPVMFGQFTCFFTKYFDVLQLDKIYYSDKAFNKTVAHLRGYLSTYKRLEEILKPEVERLKIKNFEKNLQINCENLFYTIDDVDLMGGLEFERFIAELFTKMGYEAEVTKASGDQGIDVIVEKNGRKIGIQAKCYSSKVTNSAIQEAVAGIQHYRLDKGMVITNNWFTASAQELAESNNIILWDRNRLKEKLAEITF